MHRYLKRGAELAGTSRRVHQATPLRAALLTARFKAARRWADPAQRRVATDAMHLLVGCTERFEEVATLARRYLFQELLREEMVWRPHLTSRQTVVLNDALRPGERGVIVNFMHHGLFVGLFSSLAAHGVSVRAAAAPQYFDLGRRDYWGRRDRAHIESVQVNGVGIFPAAGSFDAMVDMLAHGHHVALAHDLPGSMPSVFLRRRVSMSSGVARLAIAAKAPIVPVSGFPDGIMTRFVAQPPILPQDFNHDLSALHTEVVRRHEAAVLAWPEALEWPHLRWKPLPISD